MFPKRILSKISAYFPENARFVLALSGGADSVFLAEIMTRAIPPAHLFFAHFDHDLRENSATDADFCAEFAHQKGVFFATEKWKTPQKSEEKARNARSAFLEKIRNEQNANAIVLGTHFDDLVETIFFRFLRGSGARGLSGISEFSPKTHRFRPLLETKKEEILHFLQKEQIPFRTDESNFENHYSRNFLRNEILPLLETRFPHFRENLVRQSVIFRDLSDFSENSARDFFQKISLKNHEIQGKKSDFFALPLAVRREVIRLFFAPKTPDFKNVETLLDFLENAKSGKKMIFDELEFSVFSDDFFCRGKNLFF